MQHLDHDDVLILHLLQQNAKLNYKEIADRIGKAPSRIHDRIKKMETLGYIKNYVAILNPHLIDRSLTAFTHVKLKEHAASMMKQFERDVVKFSEVMECYQMTGDYDFLLKIELQDMNAYSEFILEKLAKLANVGNVQSFFVLTQAKKETAYQLMFKK